MGNNKSLRFSLVTLIGVVMYGGAWCTVLFSLTDATAVVLNTLVFVVLLTSIAQAISSFGQARAFWLGFSLCGCFFDIYVLVPGNNFLATTYLIRWIYDGGPNSPFWSDWSIEAYRFAVTANALFSILIGATGGQLARYFCSRQHFDPSHVHA